MVGINQRLNFTTNMSLNKVLAKKTSAGHSAKSSITYLELLDP